MSVEPLGQGDLLEVFRSDLKSNNNLERDLSSFYLLQNYCTLIAI